MTDGNYSAELILDGMDIGFVLLNGQNRLLLANARARRMLGLDDDSIGKEFVIRNESPADELRSGRQVLVASIRPGNKKRIALTSKPMEPDLLLIKLEEIDSADAADRKTRVNYLTAVNKIVSRMNHEIKNPLAGLYAGFHLLEQELSADEQNLFIIRLIMEEAKSIDRIINRVLDAARSDPIEFKRISVMNLLSEIVADGRQVRLVGGPAEMELWADEAYLARAVKTFFHELTDNLKSGESIGVGWKEVAVDECNSEVAEFSGPVIAIFFEFCDTTPQESILCPVRSVPAGEISEKVLALYAAQEIVEAHGGSTRISAASNGNAVFEILMPFGKQFTCCSSINGKMCGDGPTEAKG